MEYYIKCLNLPTKAVIFLAALFLCLQIVGEILEVKGKAVPEFVKIRKYFARKKQEKKTLADVQAALDADKETLGEVKKTLEEVKKTQEEVQKTLSEINIHYSTDNIAKRDGWMSSVNQQLSDTKEWREELDKKLDKNNAITLDILIENKRSEIISFASYVSNEKNPVTHDQFNRIYKLDAEYEAILKENKKTNGETTASMRIINEAYETHMRNHSFVEDTRWRDHTM